MRRTAMRMYEPHEFSNVRGEHHVRAENPRPDEVQVAPAVHVVDQLAEADPAHRQDHEGLGEDGDGVALPQAQEDVEMSPPQAEAERGDLAEGAHVPPRLNAAPPSAR